MSLGHLKI